MDALSIIYEAGMKGINLRVIDGKVRCRPKDKATDSFMEALSENKQAVITLLREQEAREHKTEGLLVWASGIARENRVLEQPVEFVETTERRIRQASVSRYAREKLVTISYCRSTQYRGGMGRWSAEWFRDREIDALVALSNLRDALESTSELS